MTDPLRISIVDDDESVRESLESLLKSLGYRVLLFESAEEFQEAGAARLADCLILDMRLGGKSGLELRRELVEEGSTLPVIFITANGSDALRAKLMEEGAVECLFKPLTEEALLAALDAAVGPRE